MIHIRYMIKNMALETTRRYFTAMEFIVTGAQITIFEYILQPDLNTSRNPLSHNNLQMYFLFYRIKFIS